mmetsp:Transcript_29591/g.76444  ORF Transcript_29591/g.76444 Transcript_29591/m.76444 type:complete len:161 (-) Transcript_29591:2040-2522(-)
MKAFGTSPDHFYTYVTHGNMSIFFGRRAEAQQITPSTRPPCSAGRRSHHAHSAGACGPCGPRKDPATKHAHPLRTTRTRAAGRSSKCRRRQRAGRRATKSRLRNSCMRAAALLGHGMQPSDGLRRAAALRPLPRSPGQCSCLMRLTLPTDSARDLFDVLG